MLLKPKNIITKNRFISRFNILLNGCKVKLSLRKGVQILDILFQILDKSKNDT